MPGTTRPSFGNRCAVRPAQLGLFCADQTWTGVGGSAFVLQWRVESPAADRRQTPRRGVQIEWRASQIGEWAEKGGVKRPGPAPCLRRGRLWTHTLGRQAPPASSPPATPFESLRVMVRQAHHERAGGEVPLPSQGQLCSFAGRTNRCARGGWAGNHKGLPLQVEVGGAEVPSGDGRKTNAGADRGRDSMGFRIRS